ncbi:MAG: hypothetical protein QXV32_08540 [Conexivisphaerales archaeon]
MVPDSHNMYRYLLVEGKVVEITEKGAQEHIDKLAFKYTGASKFRKSGEDERRVMLKIQPQKVIEHL